MNQFKLYAYNEFFSTQANHWALFSLVLLVSEATEVSGMAFFAWILTGLLPAVLFFFREYLKNVVLQVVAFFGFVGCIYLLRNIPEMFKACMLFLGLLYFFLSIFKSTKNNVAPTKPFPPFVPLIINFFMFMVAIILTRANLRFVMHFSAILSILFSFFAFYLDQLYRFTVANFETSSNLPQEKIFRSGMLTALCYLGVVSAIMLFIASFAISDNFFRNLFAAFKEKVKQLIAYIRSLIEKEEFPSQIQDGLGDGDLLRMENMEPSKLDFLWKILEGFITVLVIVAIASILAYIAYKIYKWYASLNFSKKDVSYFEEEEVIDVHENLSGGSVLKKDLEEDDSFLSPTQRIRRLYRKKALSSAKDSSVLFRMTAREFAVDERIDQMAPIYEKARYSQDVCTKEDVREMQVACRRKSQ